LSTYLDHAATTPVRPEVRAAAEPFLTERFGNPSSMHATGRAARAALEEARERVARALGARRREICFTSGGTEADNLAVLGRWRARDAGHGDAAAVVCSAVEHRAVLEAARAAGREGARVVVVAVTDEGRVEPGAVRAALDEGAAVVSVLWASNEVGTVQPVAEIAAACRAAGAVFHTDAVQAVGRVAVRVDDVACDLLSLSGHKLGAPKGIGALYVRDGVLLAPLLHGGGQQEALRPGTEPVAAAVALATAVELAVAERAAEAARLAALRDRLEAGLVAAVPGLRVNGAADPAHRLPHILHVAVPGVEREAGLMALDVEGLAVSAGSACQSGGIEASHVLAAMGRAGDAGFRLSLGRTTTPADIDHALAIFPRVMERIRALGGS
jgi:cysteine desulfurase